eukprot:1161263-Pelagomonas_calceolata.AAC.42
MQIVVRSELNVLVLSVSAKIVEAQSQAAASAKRGVASAASSLGRSASPGGMDRASSAGSKKVAQQQQQEAESVPVLDEQRGVDVMQAQHV